MRPSRIWRCRLALVAGMVFPALVVHATAAAGTVKIRMTVGATVIATATLDDAESARQFAARLPLTLTLKDHAATEKVADLPGALSTRGAPPGYKPMAGDLAYYAPWGNLAIFHKDFEYSSGLVRLGRLDTGLDILRRPGSLEVRLEIAVP
jgi:hypothetical protein